MFTLTDEQKKWIVDQCDDTAGLLVKESTLHYLIEHFANLPQPQPTTVNLFEIGVSIAFNTDEGMREKTLHCRFTAKDEADALRSGVRFGQDRLKCLYHDKGSLYEDPQAFICCYKLAHYSIGDIDNEGTMTERRSFPIFEWKYDYPGPFEHHIESFCRGRS